MIGHQCNVGLNIAQLHAYLKINVMKLLHTKKCQAPELAKTRKYLSGEPK